MSTQPLEEANSQIATMVARSQIRDLLARYIHGIDGHEESLLLPYWHTNGRSVIVDDAGVTRGDHRGHAAIKEWLHGTWRDLPKSHHIAGEPLISIDLAEGRAVAVSQVTASAIDSSGRSLKLAATYRDVLVYESSWMMYERVAELHYWLPSESPWSPEPSENVRLLN